ncbi:unnamed protein product, partial [Ixodes pacificus]
FTDTEPGSLSKGYLFLTKPEKSNLRDRRNMRVRSFCAAAVLFLCALFPGKGSCQAQRCEAEQFVACFQDA